MVIKKSEEDEVLRQLESFLKSRIDAAERGEISTKSVEQIFDEVGHELAYVYPMGAS